MVVLLSEIKRSKVEMEEIGRQFGHFFGVYVDAKGRAGGLALLWNKSVHLNILSYSSHHIDVEI